MNGPKFSITFRAIALALVVFFQTIPISATPAILAPTPFIEKFGGPYSPGKPSVSSEFRAQVVNYAAMWRSTLSALGNAGLSDKKGFEDYLKTTVTPLLAKLEPKTAEERKLKESCEYVREVFRREVSPESLTQDKIAEIDGFLASCKAPGDPDDLSHKLGGMLLRHSLFVVGLTEDEAKQAMEKMKKEQTSPGH